MTNPPDVEVLKTIWRKQEADGWGISGVKGLKLRPSAGYATDYFAIDPKFEVMTPSPGRVDFQELIQSFGFTDFLLQQSIVPVVAFHEGDRQARMIGTAFFISCSGYLITASHVITDPIESGYAIPTVLPEGRAFPSSFSMGVLVPVNPAQGRFESLFLAFENARYWGEWKQSPLLHEPERFVMASDVAVCKVAPHPRGTHQPLNLSSRAFNEGEATYTIGYAEMQDIPLQFASDGSLTTPSLKRELFVSVGTAGRSYPQNHQLKEVPTPGPCFDYQAKIPGKMSGAPIIGAGGIVVRGVVSKSYSGETFATGAMLGPVMNYPLANKRTLIDLMRDGTEGMPHLNGQGL